MNKRGPGFSVRETILQKRFEGRAKGAERRPAHLHPPWGTPSGSLEKREGAEALLRRPGGRRGRGPDTGNGMARQEPRMMLIRAGEAISRVLWEKAKALTLQIKTGKPGSHLIKSHQITLFKAYSMIPSAPAFRSWGMSSRTTSSRTTTSMEYQFFWYREAIVGALRAGRMAMIRSR